MRHAWAEVDLAAVRHNIATLVGTAAPAAVWAVVKADGYGHGAVPVAHAALDAGATGLCVALAQEGVELRAGGVTAPVLVLSEQPAGELAALVAAELTATVYTQAGITALAAEVAAAGRQPLPVHLKIDTGMHRVGADPAAGVELAARIANHPELALAGVYTHLACADEPDATSNRVQLARFEHLLDQLDRAGLRPPLVHAANSAAALALPAARFSMVRVGIAGYGIVPGPGVAAHCAGLRPAMALKARVGYLRRISAGESLSYGWRHTFDANTTVATIPIGYADGVPRRLFATGGAVLIHGRRCPIVGAVTMDQLMVDVGRLPVAVGDEVVLLGAQPDAAPANAITAQDWADRLGTIPYEIVCGISKRIQRLYL